MKRYKNVFWGGLYLVITLITLINSLEHHDVISGHYGEIALVFDPLIAITSFVIGSIVLLMFQWGINVINFEKIVRLLPNPERAIMEVLFNRKRISQAELTAETGLSKQMSSRTLTKLEKKGVISRMVKDGKNIINSKLHRAHSTAKIMSDLPGLSEKRLFIMMVLILLFGFSFSALNSYHIQMLGHPLRPAMYLLAIEFLGLGGITSLLFRKRIINKQTNRIFEILPEDERKTLQVIFRREKITQKELVDETGIYKMKMSRLLSKFESHKLIDRKTFGYTNLIISRI